MKMTPFNIALFVVAALVGLFIGIRYPGLALLLLIPVLIFVVVVLMRNKSGAVASPEALAHALQMTPAAGKARLYVMRKGFVGGQQGMNIAIDGQLQSQIRTKYFLMAELDPGAHQVKARMSSGTEGAARTHDLMLAAGDIVLLDMKLNMGALQDTPDFTEIRDPVQARQMLEGCRLVEWKAAT